jgi:hypothetical protein
MTLLVHFSSTRFESRVGARDMSCISPIRLSANEPSAGTSPSWKGSVTVNQTMVLAPMSIKMSIEEYQLL